MTVALVTTGGTIASVRGTDGASTPVLAAADLLAGLAPDGADGPEVRVVDLLAKDSAVLTLADMQRISDAVGEQLRDPACVGVVVLHGTDAMEETALLLDLQHRDARPVVVTGAQRTADAPDADGPANVRAALAVASSTTHRGEGVLVAMGGRVLRAAGLAKRSTDAVDGFVDTPGLGRLPHLTAPVDDVRVDVVAVHPGCDATHLDASLAAGAQGIVLAGLGAGNATPAVVAGVERSLARGVPVVVSTRVPEG
ncbi:MAG TPA: asparaginase domain-containing protein, partial [Nocardioides sp.]